MERIILNLLANAFKHTPEGGVVHLLARREGGEDLDEGRVRFVVEDSGPGIPEQERGRVWERFTQTGESQERGSGLGLAMVRELAAARADDQGRLAAKIFLVEDDAVVRKVIFRILDRVGAEVEGVEDAEAALEAIEDGIDVHVIITDLGLPGMKGSTLIGEIRKRLPDTPVIAISGYPKGALTTTYDLPPEIPVLGKPFTPGELVSLVRSVVSQES